MATDDLQRQAQGRVIEGGCQVHSVETPVMHD